MLDSDYVNRAAPPGSLRYFALLYAPKEVREVLTALFTVEFEIRATVSAAHEVAHTRLQWWRGEADRLVNRNAQHPATRVLQDSLPQGDFGGLHEALVAADMDLARMTYNTRPEFERYLEKSGGALFDMLGGAETDSLRRIGGLVRRVETLRDLARDSTAGRVYWPLNELIDKGVAPERLFDRAQQEKMRPLISSEARLAAAALREQPLRATRATSVFTRPLYVLAELHAKLAERLARGQTDVFQTRAELGSLEKVWTAWRAARRV